MSRETDLRIASWSAERRFYSIFILAVLGAVLLGFARTFVLRPWFPEWAASHSPPEPFFFFHGTVFAAWFLLLLVQSSLVAAGRVSVHRRLGQYGVALAILMVFMGITGGLIGARRPTGFVDVDVPPLQFLALPLIAMAQFATFVGLAYFKRRSPQSHKRLMLLASISLVGAAVARWPFEVLAAESPVPGFGMVDLVTNLFLLPMIVWDIASIGRVHAVTLWGGIAIVVLQPLTTMLSATAAWLSFATWAVSLLG